MSEIINAASGPKIGARVDLDHRLHAKAVSLTQEQDIAARLGDVYCITTANAPISGATGVILYLKNTSSTKLLIIERLLVSFAVAGAHLSCQLNDTGTPAATTPLVQVNTNASSPNLAPAEAFTTSGTAISGLTDGKIVAALADLPATPHLFPIDGTFILGNGNVFTLDIDADGAGGAQSGNTSFILRYRFVPKADSLIA